MASQSLIDDKNLLDDLVTLEKIKKKKNRKMQLMLLSDNDELKRLHYYIFGSSHDIDFYVLEEVSPEEFSLLYDMDIIIFNSQNDVLKESVLSVIGSQGVDIKFFEISQKDYLRQRDLLEAHNSGIHKLFKRDFMLEEYVMNIEIFLQSNFYTKRLLSLKENKELVINKKDLFESRVNELLKKKIFFSLHKFSYDSDNDISSYNLKKIVREYDTIYYDSKNGKLHFLILNTIPSFANRIIRERVKNFSIYLEKIDCLSSFELVYEDK